MAAAASTRTRTRTRTCTRRIAIIGVSGTGKTTLSRRLAKELDVSWIQLDELVHLSGWKEASDEDVRGHVIHAIAERERDADSSASSRDGWVIDGNYEKKLGDVRDLIFDRADVIVWLDLPLPLILYRLTSRILRDVATGRDLFNGNQQTLRFAFFEKDGLIAYAVKQHFVRRRTYPRKFEAMGVTAKLLRLRSPRDVEAWVQSVLRERSQTGAEDEQEAVSNSNAHSELETAFERAAKTP